MHAAISFTPLCNICNKPVTLSTAKADAQGRTVHEGCYLMLLKSMRQSDAPADPA
jgi:hypothetical protein